MGSGGPLRPSKSRPVEEAPPRRKSLVHNGVDVHADVELQPIEAEADDGSAESSGQLGGPISNMASSPGMTVGAPDTGANSGSLEGTEDVGVISARGG